MNGQSPIMLTDEQQARTVEAILAGKVVCQICLELAEANVGPRVNPDDPDLLAPRPRRFKHELVNFSLCARCWQSWSNWDKNGHGYWSAWKKHRKQQVGRLD